MAIKGQTITVIPKENPLEKGSEPQKSPILEPLLGVGTGCLVGGSVFLSLSLNLSLAVYASPPPTPSLFLSLSLVFQDRRSRCQESP